MSMSIVNVIGSPAVAALADVSAVAPSAPAFGPSTPTGTATSQNVSRDSQIADLSTISTSVNLLQQAASSTATDSADLLQFPTPAPMPAPKAAPAVPTDDHGQSNIVFSDSDADGTLIH
jgi:hypothetical protein